LLDELQNNIEGKSKEQIDNEIKNLEVKYEEMIENKAAELNKSVEEIRAENSELKANLEAVAEQADKLDVKMQENKRVENRGGDELKSAIRENFDEIKNVRKGNTVEIKAVADMTLGTHLTGDQPRDYNFDVVMTPSQKVNVADLVGSVQISGGTYTFVREGTSEGSISTQVEGQDKSQIDYDTALIDVNTDFLAGYATYSRKMANNLPYLESFLPKALRRDYWKAENAAFNTVLAAGATASTEVITGQNKVEMLIAEIARLEGGDYEPNAIVVPTADFYDILVTEKSTGAGYGLPGVVTYSGGQMAINGIPVLKANWLAANKYYVADWSRINKVVTEGLGLEFSTETGDNFVKNNITARIEAQVALAIEQPAAIVYGDFTAV
jgi:HK97 family phage major capsid protein